MLHLWHRTPLCPPFREAGYRGGSPEGSLAIVIAGLGVPTVVSLAEGIYADRAYDRLPVLADALRDAGCEDPDVVSHCRGPGSHVRGCWVVDLVLGKS